jgi:hypothetical protein
MRIKALASIIHPPKLQTFHKPADDGAGGGGGGAGDAGNGQGGGDGAGGGGAGEKQALGSAFAGMIKAMTPGGEEGGGAGGDKTEEEKKAAADAEEKRKSDAAAAAAAKSGKKPAKDALTEILTGAKPEAGAGAAGAGDDAAKKAAEVEAEKKRAAEIQEQTKGMSAAARENFTKLAAARDAAEQKAATLASEVEKLKAQKPEIPADAQQKLAAYEALKVEHEKLEKTLEQIGVERSPAYQRKYVAGRQAKIDKAKELVKKFGGDPNAFVEALSLQGKERSVAIRTAMADMDEFDVQRVAGVVTELEALDEEAASYLGNAKKSLQEEERNAQAQEQERAVQTVQAKSAAFLETANQMLHRFPDDHPLAAEANPIVDKAIADAKKFLFECDDFGSFAQAAVAHVLYPQMQERLGAMVKRNMELEAQIEELTGAEPDLGSGGGGGGGGGGGNEKPKGFAERFVDAGKAGATP